MLQRHVAGTRQVQTQKSAPQLVLMNRLLQLPTVALEQAVRQELEENPALECEEDLQCPLCGGSPCGCLPEALSADRWLPHESWHQYQGRRGGFGEEDGVVDPLDLVAEPFGLRESLRQQLRACAPAEDHRIGEYLIANIDEDGYLRCSLEEAAAEAEVCVERVAAALRIIQLLEPAGVGARTLAECLLLQVEALREELDVPPAVEPMLREHWPHFVRREHRRIARLLGLPLAEVQRAVEFVQKHLSPYPGSMFRAPWAAAQEARAQPVRPDVLLGRDEQGELVLQLVEPLHPPLRVSGRYARLHEEIRRHPHRYNEAERQHILDYLVRARSFIQGVEDRRDILRRVVEAILREQRPFIETEREEDMKPLTQARIGLLLRIDPSLISRSVAEKYLCLPSGRVVPLSFFFERSKNLKKAIENLIRSEDPRQPYSDQQICDMLRAQGLHLARRTVVKYREELNILSSRQRARLNRG